MHLGFLKDPRVVFLQDVNVKNHDFTQTAKEV